MSPGASRNSLRSWPTQKPRPAPVITTARTSSARASFSAAPSARWRSALKAFRTSGRLSVIVRTAPSRLVSTSAIDGAYNRRLADPGGAGGRCHGEDARLAEARARERTAYGHRDVVDGVLGNEGEGRAAEAPADHPRPERACLRRRLDRRVELGSGDLEVVAQGGVRGAQEGPELCEPAG